MNCCRLLVLLAGFLAAVPVSLAEPGDLWFTQDDTTAYSETSSLSRALAPLPAGAEVIEIERWGSWIRVQLPAGGPASGWVVAQKLARTPPRTPKEEESRDTGSEQPNLDDDIFLLKVTADHPLRVRVTCDAIGSNRRASERTFNKETPVTFRFNETAAISCSIRDREHLESRGLSAELWQRGELVSWARTDAIYARSVRLRSDGPWGEARSEVCRVRLFGTGQGNSTSLLAVDCRPLP